MKPQRWKSSLVSNLIWKLKMENNWFSCKHMIGSSMVRFNFSQMVWDFSLTNMASFGLFVYALYFQFGVVVLHSCRVIGVVMLHHCRVRGEPERKGRGSLVTVVFFQVGLFFLIVGSVCFQVSFIYLKTGGNRRYKNWRWAAPLFFSSLK